MTASPPTKQNSEIRNQKSLRLGHSPDPDDAFMWYPLADFPAGTGPGGRTYTPRIDTRGYRFVHVLEDIQSLNQRCEKGELEITALSIHQYPYVADKYVLTSCGASLGDNYGPLLVARAERGLTLEALVQENPVIAIPGTRTSAFLALSLLWRELAAKSEIRNQKSEIRYQAVPFDRILPAVAAGEFAAGLIIHEGQLTYASAGLSCVADLGKWWTTTRGLPLPLGGNAIRRDLGPAARREITGILRASIQYALDHRAEAVQYALNYARDLGADLADRFVGMYVNQATLDYGPRGRQAVRTFLAAAAAAGLAPECGEVEFVEPG